MRHPHDDDHNRRRVPARQSGPGDPQHHYNPNQLRVPAGQHEGGQWTRNNAGTPTGRPPALDTPHQTALAAPLGSATSRNDIGNDDPIVQASISIPAPAGPAPIPLPPYAYPGSPENRIWTEHAIATLQGIINSFKGRTKKKERDDDYCYRRYDEEIERCEENRWQVAHPDYARACRDRAMERLANCVRNRGRPSPDEPKEWKSGPNGDEGTWRNPNR